MEEKKELVVFLHLGALVMDKPKMALLYGIEREGRKWSKDNGESYGKAKNWQSEVQTKKKYVRVVTNTTENEKSKKVENIEYWNLHIPVSGSVQEKQMLGRHAL